MSEIDAHLLLLNTLSIDLVKIIFPNYKYCKVGPYMLRCVKNLTLLLTTNSQSLLSLFVSHFRQRDSPARFFFLLFFMNGLHQSPILVIGKSSNSASNSRRSYKIFSWLSIIDYLYRRVDTPYINYDGESQLCVPYYFFSGELLLSVWYHLWQRVSTNLSFKAESRWF
jgi:hypothetical protein